MNENIPKWIVDLPDEYSGKRLLTQIAAMPDGGISKPRHVLFSLIFNDKNADTSKLFARLEKDGWYCEVDENSAEIGKTIDASKTRYLITPSALATDEQYFLKIAQEFGCSYRGWSVIFPLPTD